MFRPTSEPDRLILVRENSNLIPERKYFINDYHIFREIRVKLAFLGAVSSSLDFYAIFFLIYLIILVLIH